MKMAITLVFLAMPLAAAERPGVTQLAWLAGCWAEVGAERGTEEHWMQPRGGTMLGMSRTVKNGKTVAYEFMQIREEGDSLVFAAKSSGQAGAEFRGIKLPPRRAVFENREHDFPQRVIYELTDDGILRARIEGTVNGKEKAIDYPMMRTPCE